MLEHKNHFIVFTQDMLKAICSSDSMKFNHRICNHFNLSAAKKIRVI